MLQEKTFYLTLRIDYAKESEVDDDDAEKAVMLSLCDLGNGIIGDDIDGKGTKLRMVKSDDSKEVPV